MELELQDKLLKELEETTTTEVLDKVLIKYTLSLGEAGLLCSLANFLDDVRYVFYINRIDLTESNLHNLARLDSIVREYPKAAAKRQAAREAKLSKLHKMKKARDEDRARLNTKGINMFLGVAVVGIVGLAVAIGLNETKYIKPNKAAVERSQYNKAKLFVSVNSGYNNKEVVNELYKLSKEYNIEPQGTYKFYVHPNGDVGCISGNPMYVPFITRGLHKHRRVAERTMVVVRFK